MFLLFVVILVCYSDEGEISQKAYNFFVKINVYCSCKII